MAGAGSNGASVRVVVVEGGSEHDVLEVVAIDGESIRVRTPMLFETGEELALRITDGGAPRDQHARVIGHDGPPTSRVTELLLLRD